MSVVFPEPEPVDLSSVPDAPPDDEQGWKGGQSADTGGLAKLTHKLRQLEAQLAELRGAAPLRAAGIESVPQGVNVRGDLAVQDGGNLTVHYPERMGGSPAMYVGDLYADQGTGPYLGTGFMIERPDGRNVMDSVSNDDASAHSFYIRDNQENAVVAVTTASGRGLRAPTFSPHMASMDYTTWGGVDTAGWSSLMEGGTYLWSPKLWVVARGTADAQDTTGDIRFVLTHGGVDYQVGSTLPLGFGIGTLTVAVDVPLEIPIGAWMQLKVEGRRTGGTGKIRGAAIQVALY